MIEWESYSRRYPAKEAEIEAALAGFRSVYRGGHHAVFCDGKNHKATSGGGFTKIEAPHKIAHEYACDCERWARETVSP